ncbi:hypothetical protein [Microbulbifer sp.]|uniref:hypothetical protein n=1 Tax=Microbulbifer sp. TaxID=1908541 RepID=UPI003F3F310E
MNLTTALAALFLIPAVVWGINRKVFSSKLNNVSIAAISSVLLYIFILLSAAYVEQNLDAELAALDTNGDGIFSGSEITPKQEEVMHRVTADTGRNFAPYTGALFSLIYSSFGVQIGKNSAPELRQSCSSCNVNASS